MYIKPTYILLFLLFPAISGMAMPSSQTVPVQDSILSERTGILTSAANGVKQAEIPTQRDAISFTELLAGNAGIHVTESGQIGSAPQLMMRGLHSVNLNATPYVFVDGVPVRYNRALPPFLSVYEPTRFGFVNPNDISKVHLATDGTALSEIGGRGANGAIYLYTDRGEFGGTKIDFTANYGVSTANYTVERMGSNLFKSYLWDYMKENGASDQQLQAHPVFDPTSSQYAQQTDWVDMISRPARFQDYHVKLKGGDGDASYMFSVGYTGKQETLEEANFGRVSMRFNLDYKISSKFEITNNLSYANTSSNYHEQGVNWGIHPLYVAATKAPFIDMYAYNDEGVRTPLLADVDVLGKSNPYALVHNMRNDNEENRVDGFISAKYLLTDDLSLNSALAVNYYNFKEDQYRPALGIVSDRNRIRQNSKRNSSEFTLLWNSSLDKHGLLGDWGKYTGKAGAWIEMYEEKSVYGRKINAGTDDYETLEQGIVDSASNVNFLSNLMMFYLRGDVDIRDRILLSANVNLEGSSNFGPKGRWNVYPGLRAVVDILERGESNQLAMRAGYGRSGNHDVRGYYQRNLYYPINYFGYGGMYLGNVSNPDIRPEITDTYDAGITLDLFENRLSLDGGYYYKRTHNLITSRAVPIEIGLGAQFENSGILSSQGVEIGLRAVLLNQTDGVSWSVHANAATLKNRVERLYNGDVMRTLGNISGIARENESMGSFYGYRILGVFQSENDVNLTKSDGTSYQAGDYIIEDINGDGKINEQDRQIIGSALPDLFGGFGTTVGYKGFSVNALFAYSVGQDIYNSFRQRMSLMDDYSNQSPGVANRWQSESQPGTGLSRAVYGDPSNNGVASDLWIEDGSYVRLKNITLSYDVPMRGRWASLNGLNISLTGENLLTFTRYTGLDPEVVSFSDPLLRGIDFGTSPLPRTFILGIRASF